MTDMYCVGQIVLFPYNFTPVGFFKCDGQTLQVQDHITLYSLIGNKYGGDETFFLLPDFTGVAPQGCAYFMAYQGTYPERD